MRSARAAGCVCRQDLIEDLKADLAGNFLRLCLYLMLPQEEYDARCLRYALVGFCCLLSVQFSIALRPQRLYGLLETGSQDGHFDFHTAPELCLVGVRVQ